jgi:hypothetical protein
VKGKLIRRSLKTDGIAPAKLRLADVEQSERQKVPSRGAGTVGGEDRPAASPSFGRPVNAGIISVHGLFHASHEIWKAEKGRKLRLDPVHWRSTALRPMLFCFVRPPVILSDNQ